MDLPEDFFQKTPLSHYGASVFLTPNVHLCTMSLFAMKASHEKQERSNMSGECCVFGYFGGIVVNCGTPPVCCAPVWEFQKHVCFVSKGFQTTSEPTRLYEVSPSHPYFKEMANQVHTNLWLAREPSMFQTCTWGLRNNKHYFMGMSPNSRGIFRNFVCMFSLPHKEWPPRIRSLGTTPISGKTLSERKGHSRSSGRVPGCSRSSSRTSKFHSRNTKFHSQNGIPRLEQYENQISRSNSRSDSRN